MFKRIFLLISLLFCSTVAIAADCPIIFIHGHKSEARPEGSNDDPDDKSLGGWGTWYPRNYDGSFAYHTAMTKIVSQYGGYRYGFKIDGSPAYTCDENTQLKSMSDTKRIYNFSYYHPAGNPGVISLSEESIRVYVSHGYNESGDAVITVFTH